MEWVSELGGAQGAAIALAVLFGSLLLLVGFWNRLSNQRTSPSMPSDMAELHAAMARLSGELPHLLRTMNSRLDAKMQALRNLIREADATIEELYRLRSPHPEACNQELRNPVIAGASESASAEPLDLEPGPPRPDPATALCKPTDLAAQDDAELRAQRYAHVYGLADRGLDPAGISGETGMHRGEVELVLNLRRKRVRVDRGSRSEPTPVIRSPEEAPA